MPYFFAMQKSGVPDSLLGDGDEGGGICEVVCETGCLHNRLAVAMLDDISRCWIITRPGMQALH